MLVHKITSVFFKDRKYNKLKDKLNSDWSNVDIKLIDFFWNQFQTYHEKVKPVSERSYWDGWDEIIDDFRSFAYDFFEEFGSSSNLNYDKIIDFYNDSIYSIYELNKIRKTNSAHYRVGGYDQHNNIYYNLIDFALLFLKELYQYEERHSKNEKPENIKVNLLSSNDINRIQNEFLKNLEQVKDEDEFLNFFGENFLDQIDSKSKYILKLSYHLLIDLRVHLYADFLHGKYDEYLDSEKETILNKVQDFVGTNENFFHKEYIYFSNIVLAGFKVSHIWTNKLLDENDKSILFKSETLCQVFDIISTYLKEYYSSRFKNEINLESLWDIESFNSKVSELELEYFDDNLFIKSNSFKNHDVNWVYPIKTAVSVNEIDYDNISNDEILKLPLIQNNDESESLVIYYNSIDLAQNAFERIIHLNGGKDNFQKESNQEAFHGDLFKISLVETDLDLKKHNIYYQIEIEKQNSKLISVENERLEEGISKYDIQIRTLIPGLKNIIYNKAEGMSERLIVDEKEINIKTFWVYGFYSDLITPLKIINKIMMEIDPLHVICESARVILETDNTSLINKLDEGVSNGGMEINTSNFKLQLIRENVMYKFYILPPGGFFGESNWEFLK
tara:strand:+ start:6184 stop:8034 length:1851 start_codon:yes stop_codon:yes gene_type:complete